jgi:hypothetical protein
MTPTRGFLAGTFRDPWRAGKRPILRKKPGRTASLGSAAPAPGRRADGRYFSSSNSAFTLALKRISPTS